MKLVVGMVAAGVTASAVVLPGLVSASEARDGAAPATPSMQPYSVCETRRVGRDVEVVVWLQLTDSRLDVRADQALVVADLGNVMQTRPLRAEDRVGGGYAVTFDDLPDDADVRSVSVRASRSPDDPAAFECDSTAAAAPAVGLVSRTLPSSGG